MKVLEIVGSIFELIIKLAVLIFLITLIYRGAQTAYDYGYRVFTEDPVSVGEGRIISVEIKEDQSASEIGEMLQQKGLIRDSKIFVLQELLSEYRGEEVPGIYDLSTSMTAEEMLAVISSSVEVSEEEITPSPDSEVETEVEIPEEEALDIIDEDTEMNADNIVEEEAE